KPLFERWTQGDDYKNSDAGKNALENLRQKLNRREFADLLESKAGSDNLQVLLDHKDELKAFRDRGDLKFHIARPRPDRILPMLRVVYDNVVPAADLTGEKPRWSGLDDGGAWSVIAANGFRHAETDAGLHWLRYQHRLRLPTGSVSEPELITDFMGYNFYEWK